VIFAFGDFELDLRLFELRRDVEVVAVQPKVLDVLAYLIRNRERVVSKQDLLENVWPNEVVSETALTHAVMEARRAVADDGANQRFIQTVRRRGYRFIAPVDERNESARRPPAAFDPALPSAPAAAPNGSPFLGRDRAMAALRANLEQALAGRTRVVLLVGEPGIGKTRTAEQLAAIARGAGAEVLVGRCFVEGAPAYWPWVQIVRAFVERRDRAALERLLGARAAVIGQAIPEVAEKLGGLAPPPELEPDQARFRLFDSLTAFVKSASALRPLVLVLDDLHRADRSSLLLLQFLVRELREQRVLVVGTYRDAELARDPALARLLGEIAREDPSRSIALDGLARADVAGLLAAVTGRESPEPVVTRLWEQTGGNPFFLTQIVQLAESEGRLAALADGGDWRVPLTHGVREAIRRHLDVLSEECRAALATASVVGREFSVAVVAAASGAPPERLLETLGEALAARVIVEVPQGVGDYRFSHSLVRETLAGELPAAKRVALHRRVGDALAAIHGANPEAHAAEIAHHYVQAAPGGAAAQAVVWSLRAAERATAQLAYEQAVAHYERALAAMVLAPADEARRAAVLLQLGGALWRAAEGERARDRYLEAAGIGRALGNAELVARAALGFGVWDQDDRVDEVLVRLLEEALVRLGEADSALRARVMGRLARELRFVERWERLEELSQGAVEMARRVGDTQALGDALVARHWALWGPENAEDRFAAAVEIVKLAETIDYPPLLLQGHQFRLADLLELGDIRGVDLEIDAIAWLADELHRPQHQWFVAVFRAMRAHMNGRFEEADQLARKALAIGERVHRETAVGWYGVQTSALQRAQGRLDEAAAALQIFRKQYPWVPTWRCEYALALALLGREAEARAEFDEIARGGFEDLRRDLTWLTAVAFLAETAAILGDEARAALLYELLLPHASRTVSVSPGVACYGSVARYLGRLAATLGRDAEAARHFEAALTANSRLGARPYVAETQADFAALLASVPGERDRARELAAAAGATAADLGMAPLAARVEAIERDLGGTRKAPAAARSSRRR
jgi:DNA-binding winged helix-turn-helix (wHTH) protein/tetratricopeptide (TPR) repeat protein